MTDDGTAGPATHRNADGLTPVEQGRIDARIRRANILIYVGLGGLVVIAAVFAVIGFVKPPARHPTAPFWLASGYVVLGAAYFLSLRWLGQRRLRRPGPARDLVVSADQKDLRRVTRRLQAGKTIDDTDRLAAQAIINLNYRQRKLVWLALPVPIALIALLLTKNHADPVAWVYGVIFLLLAPVAVWLQRRMSRTAAKQGIVPQDPR